MRPAPTYLTIGWVFWFLQITSEVLILIQDDSRRPNWKLMAAGLAFFLGWFYCKWMHFMIAVKGYE